MSRSESRILGPLSQLDEFILDPLIQGHSGTTPEAYRNTLGTKQVTNKDGSQIDPHPEASASQNQITRNSGPKESYDKNTLTMSKKSKSQTIFRTLQFQKTCSQ